MAFHKDPSNVHQQEQNVRRSFRGISTIPEVTKGDEEDSKGQRMGITVIAENVDLLNVVVHEMHRFKDSAGSEMHLSACIVGKQRRKQCNSESKLSLLLSGGAKERERVSDRFPIYVLQPTTTTRLCVQHYNIVTIMT